MKLYQHYFHFQGSRRGQRVTVERSLMMMLEAALLSQRAIKGRSVKKKLDEFRIKEM